VRPKPRKRIPCPTMPFKLDPILAAALAAELDALLRNVRVRAVTFDPDHREARLYTDAGVLQVRLGTGKASVAVRLLPAEEPPETARRIPLKISGVDTVPDERTLVLRMYRIRGHKARYTLVVELRPSDANVALTEGEDGIIRHLLVRRESRGRRWRSGHPYPYPKASSRLGALQSPTAEQWKTALDSAEAGRDGTSALLRNIAFTSPINAPWILDGGPSDVALERWQQVRESTGGVSYLLTGPDGPQPYPHRLGHEEADPVTLLDVFSGQDAEAEQDSGVARGLLDRLDRLRIRSAKRLKTLERQLEEAPESEAIRARGDLLLARFHEVPRGVAELELEDFDGNLVQFTLDPALSPQENATLLYKKASKAERARARLPDLIAEAVAQVEHWDLLHEEVAAGRVTSEELETALPDPRSAKSTTGESTYPYRVFRSSGGLEIRVGKGAKKNDDLTFRYARPDDVWLHARHAAGAHVVLRWTDPEAPPARDLQEAAVLAALYSKARTSGSAPVDWTRRKYVRKPRGARAGSVLMDRQETLFVEPDPEVAERLAVTEDGG
jgi:predicted ribosome quality control (RQC) complex YloA/Tae2 family protein